MKIDFHNTSIEYLKKQTFALLAVVAGLTLALLITVFALATRHDRLVLVPPGLDAQVTVEWNKAQSKYLESFALYYVTLISGVTTKNVEFITERLGVMTSPDIYPAVRTKMLAITKDPIVVNGGTSTNFVANNITYEAQTNTVFVVGEIQFFNSFNNVKPIPRVYEVVVEIQAGRPIVKSLTNYEGYEPKTLEWKTKHPDWNKEAK